MADTVTTALIGVGSTLIGTIVGALVNRAAALRTARAMLVIDKQKYTQDRLWDARKDAYTVIVAKVRETAFLAERAYKAFNDPDCHPEEYFQSEQYHKDAKKLWEAWRDTQAEYDRSRLLISSEFAAEFEGIKSRLDELDHDEIPPDRAEQVYGVFSDAIDSVLATAKREIAPEMS